MRARSFDDDRPPQQRPAPDTTKEQAGTSAVHGDVFPHHADGIPLRGPISRRPCAVAPSGRVGDRAPTAR
ncbi:MAG: hypothetical protein HEQ38_02430 [Gemmatimonas sp.]|nr:hypothetical protein [Gemmatimonas sp.]